MIDADPLDARVTVALNDQERSIIKTFSPTN
jgi:hypothetical protein